MAVPSDGTVIVVAPIAAGAAAAVAPNVMLAGVVGTDEPVTLLARLLGALKVYVSGPLALA